VNSLELGNLVAIERRRRQRDRVEVPVWRLLVQVAETAVKPQRVRRVIDGHVREPTLDDMPLLDAGKGIAQKVVLTVRGQPLVDLPRRSEERR
jgi:hypothetical protein